MKTFLLTTLATTCLVVEASEYAPVGKVISMLTELNAKITKEGEVASAQHEEFVHWCKDRATNLGFDITTGNSQAASLRAAIASEAAKISALVARIDELTAAIATNEADLKAAASIRSEEAAAFIAQEKELMDDIDTLKRAIGILEREMNKGGASMMQLKDAGSLAKTLDVMVRASLLDTSDASRLTAFVQAAQKARDSEDDVALGAPAGAVYVSQSGNIVDTLQDLLETAQTALADLRQKEVGARHNYEMLRQSLQDEVRFAQADLDEARKAMAEAKERKAAAEGELKAVLAELSEDTKSKAVVVQECMTRTASYEAEVTSRTEELTALVQARKVLEDSPGSGCSALDQVSLLQVSRSGLESARDLHRYEAVKLVRNLARKDGSNALMQLASQMTALMQMSGTFDKVKGLISDLIARLEKEAGSDATKKAFCDKELKENTAKKADKTDEIEVQTTRIERMTARSSQLKAEVATLESQLSKLAEAQARLDKLRMEEKSAFQASKTELEAAIAAVRASLQILNDFYSCDHSHVAALGAAKGIISLLEVVEADFSKSLAEITASEEAAVAMHTRLTKENEIQRTAFVADVKYKSQESQTLDKAVTELSSDRTTVQSELDAISEYLSKLHADCAETAESYAERKSRYESEIAGLREALQILESETALLQKHANRRTLRGFGHISA